MKKVISYIGLFIMILVGGCSDDSGGTVTDPFGGGTTGTGNVTISISFQSDQQGGGLFLATPSIAIKVTDLIVSVPAEQYSESFQFDGTTVVNASTATEFLEYPTNTGIATGQQWTFQFKGTIASDNQAYDVTSNYTIP